MPGTIRGHIANAGSAVSIEAGTNANLPTAGTAGRFYVETDGKQRILYDNGTSWIEKGRQAAQIGAADLGFDPATQSELDSHTGNTSNPHSVTPSQIGAQSQDAFLDHIAALTDPNADRLLVWDDGGNAVTWADGLDGGSA